MKSIFRPLCFLLIVFAGHAQAQDVVVYGTVRSAAENEPLPYATVYLQAQSIGTVCNSEGAFRLLVAPEHLNDSLVVSHLGHQSQAFHLSKLSSPLTIVLEDFHQLLAGVEIVGGYEGIALIKEAIEKIPNNYPTAPYRSKGFYRVSSQKDQQYIHLSEAVFDLYQSFGEDTEQQMRLEKMRSIKDEKASRGIELGLNPSGIYEFDLVHHLEETNLFTKAGFKQHSFRLEGMVRIDGRAAYKVTFDQKDAKTEGFKGYVLIDKETMAFVYFDYGLSPKGKVVEQKYGNAAVRAMLKLVGMDIRISKNDYQVHYKRIGSQYYLSNVGNDATLRFSSDREHYNFVTDTRVDYLTTAIEMDSVLPFTSEEILGRRKLIEHQNSIYDPQFWADHTIVLPTADFNEIAKTIEANNSANDIQEELENSLYSLPKDPALRIDSILSFYHRKGLFNGNALIALEGETLFEKSYNNALTSNAAQTQFRIGSTSKTFTSMLIALLEQENKIEYSDSIHQFLPNYPNGDITIGQLLSHRSGIPNFTANDDYLPKILENSYSIEEVVTLFCSDSLAFVPDSKFEYSNSNFVLLSLIVEKSVGKDFGAALKQYIFDPLQMNATYFGAPTDDTFLATGYFYGKPEPYYNVGNVGGSGGITSTTGDLLLWSKALETDQLLSLTNREQLYVPRSEYIDWDAYYGYGWMIDRYMFLASKKHAIRYHPGTDFGFYSMFLKQPDNGITIVLLSNTGEFPRFDITQLILEELN